MNKFVNLGSYPSSLKSLPVLISTLFSSTVPKKYSALLGSLSASEISTGYQPSPST